MRSEVIESVQENLIPSWRQTAMLLLAVMALGSIPFMASQQSVNGMDLHISGWVQSLSVPGIDFMVRVMNFICGTYPAIATWIIAMTVFILRDRPLEAVAVFAVCGIWVTGDLLSRLVGTTFPSGHTSHAIGFYGLMALLVLKNVKRRYHTPAIRNPFGHFSADATQPLTGKGIDQKNGGFQDFLRAFAPAVAVVIIVLTAIARVYVGDHKPTDVLGSLILSSIGLVAILWVYGRIKGGQFHLPLPWKKQPVPCPADGIQIAHSIASTVYLDAQEGTAGKGYNPPWPVRFLYWIAFQAPFPYEHSREALEAAAAKRKFAGLLTQHRYGYNMVAPVRDIRYGENNYQFVTEYIHGNEPNSNCEVEGLLTDLSGYFKEIGLSTWQISPGNPHAHSNFVKTPLGLLKLIDLESTLISIPSWGQLKSSMRDGHFPIFDDVDFIRMGSYVQNHSSELRRSLGNDGFVELKQAIVGAKYFDNAWKESEPRIWGRIARWVYRYLDVARMFRGIGDHLAGAESMAQAFVADAVERWERDGLIDRNRAAALEEALSTREARDIMANMGAHLALSVAIAIPIPGLRSVARFGWTAAFRLNASYECARGRISREEYRAKKSIHSVPVMLLALIPGLGAIAYVAGGTMLKHGLGRILIDQVAYTLPFDLYNRLHLAGILTPAPVLELAD